MFIFENDGQIEPHEYQITFRPFTISELRERLELRGTEGSRHRLRCSRDRYAVTVIPA